ncbi:MAG: MGMT family protein [Candidatus Omnitrophica bacterium]|nr:MGMT family protein [Candidatus Omnitrophota bacterium]
MKKLPSDWRERCTPFQQKVYEALLAIPKGQVRTYGEIARKIGKPKGARAVGQALKRNPYPPTIPCHRVIAAGGDLRGYSAAGGLKRKRQLLQREGVQC